MTQPSLPDTNDAMARATWVLADPHGGADPHVDGALLELLALATPVADLLVMGDLFVAWIDRPRFYTPFQRTVLEGFARVRAAGGHVRFVVGNRDYLVREGEAFDVVVDEEAMVDLGGLPTLLAHGDLVNPDDRSYRRWRAFSRSPGAARVLSALPGAIGRGLASDLERRMRKTNLEYKMGPLPLAHLEALSVRAKGLGAARALLGHFHTDHTVTAPTGVPVRICPGWCEMQSVLVATPDGALEPVSLAELRRSRP